MLKNILMKQKNHIVNNFKHKNNLKNVVLNQKQTNIIQIKTINIKEEIELLNYIL